MIRADLRAVLADLHARATRISDALEVGDTEFLALALPDLADDLWRLVERLAEEEAPRAA